jgi:putative glycosyltransferase (TIGR04372 family)
VEHLIFRLPRLRLLLVNVHESPDGHGVGYGMMLIRMRRALVLGQMLRARVFFVPSRSALNTAITSLHSDDPIIVDANSWAARGLHGLWWIAAPLRVGNPVLWARHAMARAVVDTFYDAVKRSTRLPGAFRKAAMRRRPLFRRLKKAIESYSERCEARWKHRHHVARAQRGDDMPPIRLRLPADREEQIAREAAALGIDPAAPIVTVHVRESGYRSVSGLRQRSWDEVRNARIETFLPAFHALAERGYTVVRLGDPTMTPVEMPGVVDLATSPARTQWLEIWCTMRSQFLVGCDSGPSWLAVLLGIPVLTVNAVHFRDLSRPMDRIICKLAHDRDTGATLSVSEMLTRDFLDVGFKSDRYECIDNTRADIRHAVLDMIDVVHDREQRSSWQNRFSRRLREVERQGLAERSALEGVAVMSRARGTLSRRFAKKYFRSRTAIEQG